MGIRSRSCRSFVLTLIFSWLFWTFGRVSLLWCTLLWVLRLGLERRLPMGLHSLALRDVVTLCIESVCILDRSEGLAVFAGVSSSVNGQLSVSWQSGHWSCFSSALCFVILRLGASLVECSSLPHSLLWRSPCGFSFLSGLFSLWLLYPGVNPVASIVTLLYSFRLTQTTTSRTVLICVVCLWFCFPHYSSLCLPDGLQYFCHGPFLVLLRVPMVRLCCLLSLGSFSWLKFYYRLH